MYEIFIDDVIGAGLFDDGATVRGVRSELEKADGDVLVRINSPGGDVFEGIAIKSLLETYDGKVQVRIDGLAASAASVVMLAGDTIEMADGAMVMIHEPWTVTVGDEAEHARTAAALDKIGDSLAGMYAKRTGETSEAIRETMRAETWYTAEEAIEAGLADSVAEMAAQACAVPDEFGYKNTPKRLPVATSTQPTADITRENNARKRHIQTLRKASDKYKKRLTRR